jgi:hypothetical protein
LHGIFLPEESMESASTYSIRFVDETEGEANMLAADLENHLRDVVDERDALELTRARTRPDAQDFGATLVLVLGTAAAGSIAKGIQSWLASHAGTKIEISDATGSVVATNIDAASAAAIMSAWAEKARQHPVQ